MKKHFAFSIEIISHFEDLFLVIFEEYDDDVLLLF